jgi:hypothetical protein
MKKQVERKEVEVRRRGRCRVIPLGLKCST